MMSSRRTGTNENISTFGNGSRDFTSLSTWEATVDIDTTAAGTSTTEVLEMFDDLSPYDQQVVIDGGTHDSTFPLVMRAAVDHENKWSRTSGVRFNSTASAAVFDIQDDSVYLFDVGITVTVNSATSFAACRTSGANDCIIGGVFIYDFENSGAGSLSGFVSNSGDSNIVFVNCLADNVENFPFDMVGDDCLVYNCTAVNSSVVGIFNRTATNIFKNCLADGNGQDFGFTIIPAVGTTHNASSDNSAGTMGGVELPFQTFTFVGATDFHLAPSDAGARELGTDLSADTDGFAFDDDIDKEIRSVPWDIGGDEQSFVSILTEVIFDKAADSPGVAVLLQDGQFIAERILLVGIVWSGTTTAGDKVILKERNGEYFWEGRTDSDNTFLGVEFPDDGILLPKGIEVVTINSGSVYLYIKKV